MWREWIVCRGWHVPTVRREGDEDRAWEGKIALRETLLYDRDGGWGLENGGPPTEESHSHESGKHKEGRLQTKCWRLYYGVSSGVQTTQTASCKSLYTSTWFHLPCSQVEVLDYLLSVGRAHSFLPSHFFSKYFVARTSFRGVHFPFQWLSMLSSHLYIGLPLGLFPFIFNFITTISLTLLLISSWPDQTIMTVYFCWRLQQWVTYYSKHTI